MRRPLYTQTDKHTNIVSCTNNSAKPLSLLLDAVMVILHLNRI